MRVLLLSDETPRTPHIIRQLEMRGYAASALGAVRFTKGKVSTRHLRRSVLKAILRTDAVCVMSSDPEPTQLARLAIICQWAGVPIGNLNDLPPYAPEDKDGFMNFGFIIPTEIDNVPSQSAPSIRLLQTLRSAWKMHQGTAYARR